MTQDPRPAAAGGSKDPSETSLDRHALERVLARAAELQAQSSDVYAAPDSFTEAQLIELGTEVGIAPMHIRQALAEERTNVILVRDERDLSTTLLGIARVRATRVVTAAGPPGELLRGIDRWMEREEGLIVKRRHASRAVWEASRDLVGNLKRALNVGGRGYPLRRASEVAATITEVEEQRVLVSLEADLTSHRERLGWESGAASVLGVGGSGALVAMGTLLPFAILPAVLVPIASVRAARAVQLRAATRAQLALEQLLDRIERGELDRPPTLLGALTAAATAALTPPRKT